MLDAESQMHMAMGGDAVKPPVSTADLAARIKAATLTKDFDYSSCADYAAKLILEWLEADPSRAQGPVENVYEKDSEGRMVFDHGHAVKIQEGWYGRMNADGVALDDLGLSGFMWGWAANAARSILELPAVPNPAIMTIGR